MSSSSDRITSDGPGESSGAQALRVARGGDPTDELVVVALPWGEPRIPRGLTSAEAAVARLIVEGLSNRQIALRRSSSLRTVANQVAAILRKLGADHRVDVITRLTR